MFEGLSIWEEEKYQKMQGTYPVISLSFANIKENTFEGAKRLIARGIPAERIRKYGIAFEGKKVLIR